MRNGNDGAIMRVTKGGDSHVLQILLVLLFLVVIASVIMVSSVYVVRQQSVAIIERFGKYQKVEQ